MLHLRIGAITFLSVALTFFVGPSRAGPYELSKIEQDTISVKIKSRIKNPDSAKFKFGPIKSDNRISVVPYCGQVSIKEQSGQYGAYVPFLVFLVYNIKNKIERIEMLPKGAVDEDAAVTDIVCKDKGYRF